MQLSAVVGWFATALGISFAWPQAIHAVRAQSLAGISGMTQVLMLVTSLSWTTYGIALDDPIIVFANLAAGIAVMITVAVLVGRRVLAPIVPAAFVVVWLLLTLVGLESVGTAAPGVMGAGLGMAMTLPQALHLRRGGPPLGVSATTYALLGATMSAWLVYGLLVQDPIVVAPNVVAVPVVVSVWHAARSHGEQLRPEVAEVELVA